MSEHHRCIKRADRLVRKYQLVVSGWLGLLVALGRIFSVVGADIVVLALLFISSTAALYGHHGLAMEWFIDTKEGDE